MALSLSSVLFYWSARYGPVPVVGGTPVHTRNGSAFVADQRGQLYPAIVNTPRFGWDTINSERRQTMLLEAASTNLLAYSEDFSHWTSGALTLTTGQPDPLGGTGATLGTATSVGGSMLLTPTFTGNGAKAASLFVKQGTSATIVFGIYDFTATTWRYAARATWTSGVPVLSTSNGTGTNYPPIDLGGGWWLLQIACNGVVAANVNYFYVYPGGTTVTGNSTVFGAQTENSVVPSSYIQTTGSPASRAVDQFYFDQSAPTPQAMAVYLRFVEQGTAQSAANYRALGITTSGGGTPEFLLYSPSSGPGQYAIYHNNAVSNVGVTVAGTPALGDVVELVGILNTNGSVRIIESINGGAVTDSGVSSTLTLAAAWSDVKIWLNSAGTTSVGINRFAEAKMVKFADLVSTTAAGYMTELRNFELGPNGGIL